MNAYRKTVVIIFLFGALLFPTKISTAALQQSSRPALIFSTIARPGPSFENCLGYRPVIFVFTRNAWRLINLPQRYENNYWVYAGRARDRAEVWAIAEWGVESSGETLEIAHSFDDGRSWRHLGALNKVSYLAGFHSFRMNRAGRGTLTISLVDDVDPNHRDGYYTYTTTNRGRTWSRNYSYSQMPPRSDNSIETLPTPNSCIPCSNQLPPDESPE